MEIISLNQRQNNPPSKHLSQYLMDNAKKMPDKLAIVDGDKSLSWQELWQAVEPRAIALAAQLGEERQQIVATLMPNSWQCVVSTLTILHAGHIVFPIDVIYKTLEIDVIIKQVKPALLLSDQVNFDRITQKQVPIIVFENWEFSLKNRGPNFGRQPAHEQLASLLFTSGTTGAPKVVAHTHQNHIWNIEVCSQVWQWNKDDSLLLSLRLSHWYGLVMGLFGALYHGNSLYLQDRFEAAETLRLLSKHQISLFTHGPTVYAKLLDVKPVKKPNLSSVRLFISGSAPLPPAVWQAFKDRFGHEILEVYGTSETGRIASNTLDERLPGSAGRLLPGVKVKISRKGEVMVKSPGLFPGYYANQKTTDANLTADGWWKTGDLGELEGDRLFLKGRLQERIRKSGYSISPRDVEWAIYNHPAVKEAYITGWQQSSGDDRLIYWLVTDATKAEIEGFCQANLPSVWRPDEIFILDKIPRNRGGKPNLISLQAMASRRN